MMEHLCGLVAKNNLIVGVTTIIMIDVVNKIMMDAMDNNTMMNFVVHINKRDVVVNNNKMIDVV